MGENTTLTTLLCKLYLYLHMLVQLTCTGQVGAGGGGGRVHKGVALPCLDCQLF